MLFNLRTAGYFYSVEHAQELEALGFKFKLDDTTPKNYRCPMMKDLDQSSPTIEIGSLDELVEFTNKWGRVVFSSNEICSEICIYDDYLE